MTFDLEAIAHEMRTQDNRITAHPLFCVFEKERIYGVEDGYSDDFVWIDQDHERIDIEEHDWSEEQAEENGCSKVYYVTRDKFVNAHFTEKAADEHIRINGHNLNNGFTYVTSLHRCSEMIAIREMLMRDSINGMLMALTEAKVALEAYRDNVNSAETWKHALGEVDNAIANALAAN